MPTPTGTSDPASFELCDGSDAIRLGYQSGGGFVDEGYELDHPYGFEFLFVDGHCDFIAAKLGEETCAHRVPLRRSL